MNKKVMHNYGELARSLGLRQESDGAALYGKCGAYDVIVYPANTSSPYMLTVSVSARRSSGPLSKERRKEFLKENSAVYTLTDTGSEIGMTLKNCANQEKLQERMASSMNALTRMLQSEGYQNCCQHCGNLESDPCYVSGVYAHLCGNCFAQLQHDASVNASQTRQKKENVLGGVVGALLGSLIGVASIVILSQLGYVAALSGILMAVCTLKGYELLAGKLSNKGIIISCVLMIVMTLLGDQLDWAIIVSRELEVDFFTAFRIFPELLVYEIIDIGNYFGNLALLYLFGLVGAVPTIMGAVKNRKLSNRMYRLGSAPVSLESPEI